MQPDSFMCDVTHYQMRLATKMVPIHNMIRSYSTWLMYVWHDSLPDEARNPNGPNI